MRVISKCVKGHTENINYSHIPEVIQETESEVLSITCENCIKTKKTLPICFPLISVKQRWSLEIFLGLLYTKESPP